MQVAVLLTTGSEELEAVTIIDILRRCSKIEKADIVISGSVNLHVECSRGVVIRGDKFIGEVNWCTYDAIVLPGGMKGAEHFKESLDVQKAISFMWTSNKLVAAICASPIAIKAAGVGYGMLATSHPCVKPRIQNHFDYTDAHPVVTAQADGRCLITSQGPGTALLFSLAIIEYLCGVESRTKVATPLMLPNH